VITLYKFFWQHLSHIRDMQNTNYKFITVYNKQNRYTTADRWDTVSGEPSRGRQV